MCPLCCIISVWWNATVSTFSEFSEKILFVNGQYFFFLQTFGMPRSREPNSLEHQCIHFIASNERLWSHTDISFVAAPAVEKLLGEVLGRIRISETRSLSRHFENSGFFGVRVNRLYYSEWNCVMGFRKDHPSPPYHEDVRNLFTKFLQSCKQLIHLELMRYCSYSDTEENLCGLLTGCDLSNSLELELFGISLREDTIGIIGSCCPKLRALNVGRCRGLNNISIKLLVKKGSDGQCVLKHLKLLDVLGTDVGLSDIEHVLASIPRITHINCAGRVLPAALKLLRCGSVAPPFHLEKLDAKNVTSLFRSEEKPTGFPLDMSAFANVKILAITLEYRKELELLKGFDSLRDLDKLMLQLYFFPDYRRPKSLDDESDGKMKVIPFEPHVSGLIKNLVAAWKNSIFRWFPKYPFQLLVSHAQICITCLFLFATSNWKRMYQIFRSVSNILNGWACDNADMDRRPKAQVPRNMRIFSFVYFLQCTDLKNLTWMVLS